jgi:hypothetical protein
VLEADRLTSGIAGGGSALCFPAGWGAGAVVDNTRGVHWNDGSVRIIWFRYGWYSEVKIWRSILTSSDVYGMLQGAYQ